MAIYFDYQTKEFIINHEEVVKQKIEEICKSEGKKVGNLQYVFVTNEEILMINRAFLDHNYYTDIITFDNGFLNVIEGEIYISIETVRNNAIDIGVKFNSEIKRVIIHGILHLIGYTDKTIVEQKVMRKKEEEYMPYLDVL